MSEANHLTQASMLIELAITEAALGKTARSLDLLIEAVAALMIHVEEHVG